MTFSDSLHFNKPIEKRTYDFGHVQLLASFGNCHVGALLGLLHRTVQCQHGEEDIWRGLGVSRPCDHTVCHNEKKLHRRKMNACKRYLELQC